MEQSTPRRLGTKTLVLFVLSYSNYAASTFAATAAVTVVKSLARPYFAANYLPLFDYVIMGGSALTFLALIFAVIAGWLVYGSYTFTLSPNALELSHGIFSKEEIAIPYGQIQSVNIRRDLRDQILGVSRLVILTAGHEDEAETGEAEGVFPPIDTALAQQLQEELLGRANTEKVAIQQPASPAQPQA